MSLATMKIRGVDQNNDWLWGLGLQSYRFTEPAVEQNMVSSLNCFLGDCFWSLGFGVDGWNLIGARYPAAEANILLQTRQIIVNSFGVVRINSVNVSFNSLTRKLSIQYVVIDIYGNTIAGTTSI